MNLLHVIGSLNPALGGPPESVRQLTLAFEKEGYLVEIATLDTADSPWLNNDSGNIHSLGPGMGKYCYSHRFLQWLNENLNRFDLVLVHGIWQYHSLATWLAARNRNIPYFVFVHGGLDPWFKTKFPLKHLKKWLYWPWAEYRVLRDASAVLFTSEEEKILARKSFWLYKANEMVVGLGILPPQGSREIQIQEFFDAYPSLREKRLFIFLGRIHPKKGCNMLIDAFAQVAEMDDDLHLVFAGPDQVGWKASLVSQVSNLKIKHRVTWTGMVEGNVKWGALYASDAFILPSHSENFGVAVVEALACGLPVLITNKINIWREIAENHAGLVCNDTVEEVSQMLKDWLKLSRGEMEAYRKNAFQCFLQKFEISRNSKKLITSIKQIKEKKERFQS